MIAGLLVVVRVSMTIIMIPMWLGKGALVGGNTLHEFRNIFYAVFAGMACFLFILGFILMTSAAIYISPYLCGSMKEKQTLRSAEEIETNYVSGGNVTNV